MATYKEIQAYVRDRYGYTPKTCWIAHVRELSGLPVRRAPNRRGSGRMVPCPVHKQNDIRDALEHFGMLEFSADEMGIIARAQHEVPILEAYAPSQIEEALLRRPSTMVQRLREPPRRVYRAPERRPHEWLFALSSEFRRSVQRLDAKLQGRVMKAMNELCTRPTELRGDTIKPLTGQHTGKWRYRVGDYRLIYQPDQESHTIFLLALLPRSSAYAK